MGDLRRWLGPVHVVFTGGEALLKPFTIELAEHAHQLGLFPEVLTHGYWDDQTKMIKMKREGYHVANSYAQLKVMIPYFRNPAALRIATQSHVAHEQHLLCAALTMLQFQANGDLTVCCGAPPAGNVKDRPIRQIWEHR